MNIRLNEIYINNKYVNGFVKRPQCLAGVDNKQTFWVQKNTELPDFRYLNSALITFGNVKNGKKSSISGNDDGTAIIVKIPAKDYKNAEIGIYEKTAFPKETEKISINAVKNKNNMFEFHIPALYRKSNSYFENISIKKLVMDGKEISKENPDFPSCFKVPIDASKYFKRSLIQSVKLGKNRPFLSSGTNIIPGIAEGKLLQVTTDNEFDKEVMNYYGKNPRIIYIDNFEILYRKLIQVDGTPNDNFYLPRQIKGIIVGSKYCGRMFTDILSHVAARLRNNQVISVFDNTNSDVTARIKKFVDKNTAQNIKMKAMANKLEILPISKTTMYKVSKPDLSSDIFDIDTTITTPVSYSKKCPTTAQVGLKAFNLWKLQDISKKAEKNSEIPNFIVPPFMVLPSGCFRFDSELYPDVEKNIDKIPDEKKHFACKSIRDVLELNSKKMVIRDEKALINSFFRIFNIKNRNEFPPENVMVYNYETNPTNVDTECPYNVKKEYKNKPVYIARSSFTGEDSAIFPTQGLYDSIAGIRTQQELLNAIRKVYSSKWNDLAYSVRRDYKIAHNKIEPNIIIQQLAPVDYTFTAYTKNNMHNKNDVIIQLSQGAVSGYYGNPYVFTYNCDKADVKRVMLAQKGRKKDVTQIFMNDIKDYRHGFTDYSNDALNKSKKEYFGIIEEIAKICKFIEKNSDEIPQDIEGGIKWNPEKEKYDIYIWQSRNIMKPQV